MVHFDVDGGEAGEHGRGNDDDVTRALQGDRCQPTAAAAGQAEGVVDRQFDVARHTAT